MGLDFTDADGKVLERNGHDTKWLPVPKDWMSDGVNHSTIVFELEGFELTLVTDDRGNFYLGWF